MQSVFVNCIRPCGASVPQNGSALLAGHVGKRLTARVFRDVAWGKAVVF